MTIDPEKAMGIIKIKGPVLPSHISKEMGITLLFASAVLSELSSSNRLKVSNLKIGGSPLYYAPGQESRLEQFSKHLHEKAKKAYDILQKEKIVRDTDVEPVVRVALREIKDFAVPLNVSVNGKKETFWKWHTAKNDEVEPAIKKMLGIKEEEKKEEKKEEKVQEEKVKVEEKTKTSPSSPKAPEPKTQSQELQSNNQESSVKSPKTPQIKENNLNERHLKKEKAVQASAGPDRGFLLEASAYLAKNSVQIVEKEVIRKDREYDLEVQLESVFGPLAYYCKVKRKARINDSDLSAAFVQGQLKKLPVIFLTNGEPTKKAKEMLNKEFKTIVFRKMQGVQK